MRFVRNELYLTAEWLKSRMGDLTGKHRQIAKFLLASPAEVLSLNVEQFAEAAGVSRATLFRFCEVLGLDGYNDLRRRFSAPRLDVQSKIDTPHMRWLTDAMYNSLYYTLNHLDVDAFHRAVSLLKDAKRVYWFGAGESGIMGELGNHRCWLLGIDSHAFRENVELSSFDLLRAKDNVFVFLSVSGNGPYLERPLQMVREENLTCIAITSEHFSPLVDAATVTLFAASPRARRGSNVVPVKIGFEVLINALVYETARERDIPLTLGSEMF